MRSETNLKIIEFLTNRAKSASCISYKDLAHIVGIEKPPIISTLTDLLENTVVDDFRQKKPILAALVVQKGSKQVPRHGFFLKLHELGVVNIDESNFDEVSWHQAELEKLKKYYNNDT